MEEKQVILSVEHLMISFSQYVGGWRQRELPVIRDLNIKVREHEVVAVAGSSGSGKSLLAHAVMGLLPQNAACQGILLLFDAGKPCGFWVRTAQVISAHLCFAL